MRLRHAVCIHNVVDTIAASDIQYVRAEVAQVVEQRTENPRVGGSTPPLGILDSFLTYATFHRPLRLVPLPLLG